MEHLLLGLGCEATKTLMPPVVWLDYEGNFVNPVFCGKGWTKSFSKYVFVGKYASLSMIEVQARVEKQVFCSILELTIEPNHQWDLTYSKINIPR